MTKEERLGTQLLEFGRNCAFRLPGSLVFAPTGSLSKDETALLEADIAYRFDLWFGSWIRPIAEELLDRGAAIAKAEGGRDGEV